MTSRESLSCVFCFQSFPSSIELSDHLMICGNKTDQCPNCNKFIRRAIFAYHYENNCGHPEEYSTTNKNHKSNDGLQKNRISKLVACDFCTTNFTEDMIEKHKEKCDNNPKNRRERNRNSSSFNQDNQTEEIVYIPCQFCDNPINVNDYSFHQRTCNKQQRRQDKQKEETVYIPCQFCNKHVNFNDYPSHQRTCNEQKRRQGKQQNQTNNQHQNNRVPNPQKRSYADVTADRGYRPLPSN